MPEWSSSGKGHNTERRNERKDPGRIQHHQCTVAGKEEALLEVDGISDGIRIFSVKNQPSSGPIEGEIVGRGGSIGVNKEQRERGCDYADDQRRGPFLMTV